MKTVSLGLISVLSTGLGLFLLITIQVSAQPLVMNTPTGSMTDGANISINPEEPLPANGTASVSRGENGGYGHEYYSTRRGHRCYQKMILLQ